MRYYILENESEGVFFVSPWADLAAKFLEVNEIAGYESEDDVLTLRAVDSEREPELYATLAEDDPSGGDGEPVAYGRNGYYDRAGTLLGPYSCADGPVPPVGTGPRRP